MAVLLYVPSVAFQLVWDDTIFLRDLPDYRDPAMWMGSLLRPFVLSPNYFRPLALLTFAGELLLGASPWALHLVNVALHALNTLLVAVLARRLTLAASSKSPGSLQWWMSPLGAGLLYGIHPALIEGVAFISGRFDLLMTSFLLLALLADHALRGRPSRPILVGLAFLAAALCKESAAAFALVLPIWHLATGDAAKPPLRRAIEGGNLHVYAAAVAAGLAYLGIRYASLGYLLVPNPPGALPTGTGIQHLLLIGKSIAAYAVLTIWPFGTLTPIHFSPLPVPPIDPVPWIALVLSGLLLAGLAAWIQRTPSSGWLAAGGALALLPAVNLLPLQLGGGAFIAERYLVFPMALVALAIVRAIRWPEHLTQEVPSSEARKMRWVWGVAAAWLMAAALTLQLTVPNWRDDRSLWTWASDRAPDSSTPFTNLALVHADTGQYALAENLARHAIDLDPKNADAWNILGLALFRQGKYEEAESAFEEASNLQPDNALFWNNLAGALREQDRLTEAEEILVGQSLRLNPGLPTAHLNLGIVYLRANRPDQAIPHLELALRLLPPEQTMEAQPYLDAAREPAPWLALGDLLLEQGDTEGAEAAFAQAQTFGASPADLAAARSRLLILAKDWANAEEILLAALQDAPGDARLYNHLGIVYREQGKFELARQQFTRAAELDPTWELPRQNLEGLQASP